MKTAKEKATEFVTRWNMRAEAVDEIALMLKMQDRDTRHACAEAVSLLRDQMGEGGDPFCAAHAACMNVKAV